MNEDLKEENLKKKLIEKDKAKLQYKQKLELLKQQYGIEFEIYYFEGESIDKIKFSNLEFKTYAKNITMVYDNKIRKFNYIFYDYDNEQEIKKYDEKKIVSALKNEKKLKLVVKEIKELNEEYQRKLLEIDEQFQKNYDKNIFELEYYKKPENC